MFSLTISAQKQKPVLQLKHFDKQKIAPGLIWYKLQHTQLFESNQSLNILKVKVNKREVELLYNQDTLHTTDHFAKKTKALAAVNAGFFDMRKGGSVSFLKKDGKLIADNHQDLIDKNSVILQGIFVVDTDLDVNISASSQERNYATDSKINDALFSGPLLMEDKEILPLDSTSFNMRRHPRTCACTNARGDLFLLTADGRNEKAAGLNLPELSQIMRSLGCEDTINLDGGGSTTMFIQGKGENGIVNFPSDNRKFDHKGQRKVANVIAIF